MNPVCRDCGIAIADSVILGRFIHVPINRTEILAVLKCRSYGKPETQPVPDDGLVEVPAIIRERWEREW